MDPTSPLSSGRRRPLGQEGGRQDPVGQRSQERQSGSRHRDLPTDAEGVPDGGVVEGRTRRGEPPDGLDGQCEERHRAQGVSHPGERRVEQLPVVVAPRGRCVDDEGEPQRSGYSHFGDRPEECGPRQGVVLRGRADNVVREPGEPHGEDDQEPSQHPEPGRMVGVVPFPGPARCAHSPSLEEVPESSGSCPSLHSGSSELGDVVGDTAIVAGTAAGRRVG